MSQQFPSIPWANWIAKLSLLLKVTTTKGLRVFLARIKDAWSSSRQQAGVAPLSKPPPPRTLPFCLTNKLLHGVFSALGQTKQPRPILVSCGPLHFTSLTFRLERVSSPQRKHVDVTPVLDHPPAESRAAVGQNSTARPTWGRSRSLWRYPSKPGSPWPWVGCRPR